MISRTIKTGIFVILAISFASLYAFGENEYKSTAKRHPVEIKTAPMCVECHKEDMAVFNHTSDFGKRHKYSAYQNEAICEGCHSVSFCADCHANKEQLKPSDKYKESPELDMPHRGDYITQHKIDGKINPAPCMKCHGRRNNERCKTCHR